MQGKQRRCGFGLLMFLHLCRLLAVKGSAQSGNRAFHFSDHPVPPPLLVLNIFMAILNTSLHSRKVFYSISFIHFSYLYKVDLHTFSLPPTLLIPHCSSHTPHTSCSFPLSVLSNLLAIVLSFDFPLSTRPSLRRYSACPPSFGSPGVCGSTNEAHS